ncbi:MAG: carboxymuconolactone decarboxylase family protein [Rhodoferax sp.]|nr:carboxymuconolactone decarboxylase family protein [Rhodoferax sp.]
MSASSFINTLTALTPATATGTATAQLADAQIKMGFVPAMYANMANAPAVLSTYLHGYGLFRTESGLSPAEQEIVFLATSIANGCDYCTAAHSMVADKMSGVPAPVLQAIRTGTTVPDAKLEVLRATTTALVLQRGQLTATQAQAFYAAGYSEHQLLYIVLALAVKTLSNYSNHAFDPQLDAPFAAYAVGTKA